MKTTQNKILILTIFNVMLSFVLWSFSEPLQDDSAGTYSDDLSDKVGIQTPEDNTTHDEDSGTIALTNPDVAGSYTTTEIVPASFDKWDQVCLEGTWGDTNDFNVDILDAATGLPATNTLTNLTVGTDGCIDISSLSNNVDSIKVRVNLPASNNPPVTISKVDVSWNPITQILFGKRGTQETESGAWDMVYRLRYSVSLVDAQDVYIWDTFPTGNIPNGLDFGQDEDPEFIKNGTSAGYEICDSDNASWNGSGCDVKGDTSLIIPGNSIYWHLGDVPAGTTKILQFRMRSQPGAVDGVTFENTANISAENATPGTNTSQTVTTTVTSATGPVLDKSQRTILYGSGIYDIGGGTNVTTAGSSIEFAIKVENKPDEVGTEHMYNTVLFDDLSVLAPFMTGTVTSISGAGVYWPGPGTTNINGTLVPSNSVYWDLGTLERGEEDTFSFRIQLDSNVSNETWTMNTATLNATNAVMTNDHMQFQILNGIVPVCCGCSKANSRFPGLHPETLEPLPSYYYAGETVTYWVNSRNNSSAYYLDYIVLDMIPPEVTFVSASMVQPDSEATIFYSTNTTYTSPTNNFPPTTNLTEGGWAGIMDEPGGSLWSTNPPADLSKVTWIAIHEPKVSSISFPPADPVEGFQADIIVQLPQENTNDPCANLDIYNYAKYEVNRYLPVDHTNEATQATNWNGSTRTLQCRDWLTMLPRGGSLVEPINSITPCTLIIPGTIDYELIVENDGVSSFTNVVAEISWTTVPVAGEDTYASFAGISGASIDSLTPTSGTMTVSLGVLPPEEQKTSILTLAFPEGIPDGQRYTISTKVIGYNNSCTSVTNYTKATCKLVVIPDIEVEKASPLSVIGSGDQYDYVITARNIGDGPSTGTWVVDRVPDKTVFIHATGGQQLYVSDKTPPELPDSVTTADPITADIIASDFTEATWDGSKWISPYGDSTTWMAWLIDEATLGQFESGTVTSLGFRVQNDETGPETPGGGGSASNTKLYNDEAIFSDQNLFALGNQVITTILDYPGLDVVKTGPDPAVVTREETFEWHIDYYNNSASPDDTVIIVDTLPANVLFVSATHVWNSVASNYTAIPSAELPSSIATNGSGEVELTFNITDSAGLPDTLLSLEGGRITITVTPTNVSGGDVMLNGVEGCATSTNGSQTNVVCDSDEHKVTVENPDLCLTKSVDKNLVSPGDTITYIIELSNIGDHAAYDVELQDFLPTGLTYKASSTLMLSPGYSLGEPTNSVDSNGITTLSWTTNNLNTLSNTTENILGYIPENSDTIFFMYKATVNADVEMGSSLANLAQVTTSTEEDPVCKNQDSEKVTFPPPDPEISKSGQASALPGEVIPWEMSYQNMTPGTDTNVYIIDSLPDLNGDNTSDVTFVSAIAIGPGGPMTNYYHSPTTNPPPAFDPLNPTSGLWTTSPTGIIVSHVAWVVGTLEPYSGPFAITLYTKLTDPVNGVNIQGVTNLTNKVIIVGVNDSNPSNNFDEAETTVPGVEMILSKSCTPEGLSPGALPGDEMTYTFTFENDGIVNAYGLTISDNIPTNIVLNNPPDNFVKLEITDASGLPLSLVDENGTVISGDVYISRVQNGNDLFWYFGTTNTGDATYYRKVGLPPGSRGSFTVSGYIHEDTPDSTIVDNSATLVVNNATGAPNEEITANNSDNCQIGVYEADVGITKVVVDLPTTNEVNTEAGNKLLYTLTYQNTGNTDAENVIISEIIPLGTTYVPDSITNLPAGATVTFLPSETNATSFEINLGTLPAPSTFDSESTISELSGTQNNTEYNNDGDGGIQLRQAPTEVSLVNTDFETGDFTGWTEINGGGSQNVANNAWQVNTGSFGVWFFGWDPNIDQGVFQDATIIPGEIYQLDAYVRLEGNFTAVGGTYALELIWLDDMGVEISRETENIDLEGVVDPFAKRSVNGTAPSNAAEVRVQVNWTTDNDTAGADPRSAMLDDIKLWRM